MSSSLSEAIPLPQERRWVFSIRDVSRKIIFILVPITPFLGLSEGLRLPLPLGNFGYQLTVSGIMNLATCVIFFFFLLHNLKPFRYRIFLPATLFLIAYLTMIHPPLIVDGVMDWLKVAGWVSSFYIGYLALDQGEKDLIRLSKLALLASVPPLILSLFSYFTGRPSIGWFGDIYLDPTLKNTYASIRVGSRSSAGYLFVLLPWVIAAALLDQRFRKQIVAIFYTIASFLSAWFAYGRANVGGLLVFFGPFALTKIYRKIAFVFIFILLPALIFSDWETMKLRFSDTPIIKDLAFKEGEKIVAGTAEDGYYLVDPSQNKFGKWERAIIWGISLSRWWEGGVMGRLFGLGPRSLYDHGRNIFICVLGESGLISLVFFLFFLISLFIPSWRLYRLAEGPYQKTLALLSLATFVSFLFVSMFDVPIRSFDHMMYRTILWGMVLREYQKVKSKVVPL